MRTYKIFAVAADLHIGVRRIRADILKQQLKDFFFSPLKKLSVLDGIFILGDVTHTILSLNSDYSQLFHWFMSKLYKLAKNKHATVIIIKGTISHDNDQLNNLISGYVDNDDNVDFRIYDNPTEITLWGDYKTLILPDVKVKSAKEIDNLLNEQYDMILGHGLIDQMAFSAPQESEVTPLNPYVYKLAKLKAASRGPILFGHIHQFHRYGNFHYVGPFTVLERNGVDAGFCLVGILNDDKTKWKLERYINEASAATYEVSITSSILATYPVTDIIEVIDSMIEEAKSNDLFTIRITRETALDSPDSVAIIENRYRRNPMISIVKKVLNDDPEDETGERQARKARYEYCMDTTLPVPAIMYTYYQTEMCDSLPIELRSLTEEVFYTYLDLRKENGSS